MRGGREVFSAYFRPLSDLLSGWAAKLRTWKPAENGRYGSLPASSVQKQHVDSAHSLNIYSSKNIVAYLNMAQH